MTQSLDSFKSRKKLKVGTKTYVYYSLKEAEKNGLAGIAQLPFSLKVLIENLLRFEDGRSVTKSDIEGCATWLVNRGKGGEQEIADFACGAAATAFLGDVVDVLLHEGVAVCHGGGKATQPQDGEVDHVVAHVAGFGC